jgi:cell wall-associated NlpC family hydrolase
MVNKTLLVLVASLSLAGASPTWGDEAAPAIEVEQVSLLDRTTTTIQDLLLKGLELVGVSYRRGGTDPDAGLDCSGFVRIVFRDALGLGLPRTAKEMSSIGQRIDRTALQPGDLVFFNTMRRAFSHVGIYLGDSKFLHSPRPGGEVRVEDMRGSYWTQRYDGARRVIDPI